MQMTERTHFRLFLSSTSTDLGAYRDRLGDVVAQLQLGVTRMETFGASPDAPFDVCMKRVDDADALVVIVGYRYGWIPTREQGGDGERSITWHEVAGAFDSGKPVFAFIADDQGDWTGPRDEDEALVARLESFKAFLAERVTFARFSTPDELAVAATISLANWLLEHANGTDASVSFNKDDFRMQSTMYKYTRFPLDFEYVGRDGRAVSGAIAKGQSLVVKFQDSEASSEHTDVWLTIENRGAAPVRWFGHHAVTCYPAPYTEVQSDPAEDPFGSHLAHLYPGEQITAFYRFRMNPPSVVAPKYLACRSWDEPITFWWSTGA